jgi:hypothetical protein
LTLYNSKATDTDPMAIYSQCSDLQTRETMWVGRPSDDAPQYRFAGQINPAEGWWIAGISADSYAADVVVPDLQD